MPVDIQLIRRRGGTADKLREKFDRDAIKPGSKIAKLIELGASRINDGITQNWRDSRLFWAIDRAYDVSQRQITYTLVEGLISSKASAETVMSAVKSWGLDDMLVPADSCGKSVCDAKGNPLWKLDLPTFFTVYVPAVMAMIKVRWAKLFNERNQYPHYKYEPQKLTIRNGLISAIVTDRIQRMSSEMDYLSTERQTILQTLLYGQCVNFPMEDWYKETQLFGDGDGKEKIVREGIRYITPHPTRTFYDINYPLASINSDTGVEWLGYWDVVRYRDIETNSAYWNKGKVSAGYGRFSWPGSPDWAIFRSLYPCRMAFPDIASISDGAGDKDRLNRASGPFYTGDMGDQATTITPLFQKLVPSEWDLYDYDHPVWHRMVYAGEDTVIHASPLAYTPGVAYLYDWDGNRVFNTSLALELLPWQDQLGNLLTQYLLSLKQNLNKVVFWNTNSLEQKDIDAIQNRGEKMYREIQFIPIDRRALSWEQASDKDAFWPVTFPQMNTQEIAMTITTMVALMERMVGFSAQEMGAAATHEQTAKEMELISLNTSSRLALTGSFIDSGRFARKRQLYDATMAYSSDEVTAEVADVDDVKRAELEKMGFKIEDESKGSTKAGIRGPTSSLTIEGFASGREDPYRISDPKIAASMVQVFSLMFSNPKIVEQTGVGQLVEMFNQIAHYAGVPKDFKLRVEEGASQKAQAEAAAAQMQQLQQQIVQLAGQSAQEVVQKEMAGLGDVMREKVIGPMQAGQAQLVQAVQAIGQKLQAQDQQNGVQDQALQQIMAILQAAAQPAPAPPVV